MLIRQLTFVIGRTDACNSERNNIIIDNKQFLDTISIFPIIQIEGL